MKKLISKTASLTALMASFAALPAMAQDSLEIEGLEIVGAPVDGQMGFQPPATSVASDLQSLDWLILVIITVISVFVTALLIWCIIRFNKKRNPVAGTFTHNTPIEILWTVVPILILVFIGAYSLPVLFNQQEIPKADITIKATGNQWYWTHEYVDHGFEFDSYMLGSAATLDEDIRPADADVTPQVLDAAMEAKLVDAGYSRNEWLLATDTSIVLPVGKTVVVQVTGSDVIHSWTIPAFGVKQDAVPGRLAELWFTPEREGVYFGQCSELCGKDHAYMPITVKVVSEEAYQAWLDQAIAEYAGIPQATRVASN